MNDYIITFENEYREKCTYPMSADTLTASVSDAVTQLMKYDKENELPIQKYKFISAIKL